LYAILDIETTGGQFNEEGITEIAIYKFDGHEVVDQFISLINPEIPIQPFVIKLTGINNAMLRSAPKFYEVAKRIIEITEGCIVVAHNASFDYRIIRTEFKRLGYDFVRQTLCTVDLSKKLLPEQESYSLGKLVRSLGIPIADRHRASGDAAATVKLFKLLLAKDSNKEILTSLVKSEIESGISPKLLDMVDKVPSKTGIYYIHNEQGKIIYIAKSKNMKRKVNQHFTQQSKKAIRLQKEVFTITYEETGSELLAHLKEIRELESNKPKYNKLVSKQNIPYALYRQKNKDGYYGFRILKKDKRRKEITTFSTIQEGELFLEQVAQKYQLCLHINTDMAEHKPCEKYHSQACLGACIELESKKTYNDRVAQFISDYDQTHTNFIVVDRGRTIEERSAIWVEQKKVIGYCFFNLNHQITKLNILKNIITPLASSNESFSIVENYVRKKNIKMIPY